MKSLTASTPEYGVLADVYFRWQSAKQSLEEAQRTEDALHQEVVALAKSIVTSGITDEVYEISSAFTQGKQVTKIDSKKLRMRYTDIFNRCNPHVGANGIAQIFRQSYTEDDLQEKLREMNPVLWHELASVTKADLMKRTTKSEQVMLENSGCIYTDVSWTGDVELICKPIRAALQEKHEEGE